MRGSNLMRLMIASQLSLALMVGNGALRAQSSDDILFQVSEKELLGALQGGEALFPKKARANSGGGSYVSLSKQDLMKRFHLYVSKDKDGKAIVRKQVGSSQSSSDPRIKSARLPLILAGDDLDLSNPQKYDASYEVAASDLGKNTYNFDITYLDPATGKFKTVTVELKVPQGGMSDSELKDKLKAALKKYNLTVDSDGHIVPTDSRGNILRDSNGNHVASNYSFDDLVRRIKIVPSIDDSDANSGVTTTTKIVYPNDGSNSIQTQTVMRNPSSDDSHLSDAEKFRQKIRSRIYGDGNYSFDGNVGIRQGGAGNLDLGALGRDQILSILRDPNADQNLYNSLIDALLKANPGLTRDQLLALVNANQDAALDPYLLKITKMPRYTDNRYPSQTTIVQVPNYVRDPNGFRTQIRNHIYAPVTQVSPSQDMSDISQLLKNLDGIKDPNAKKKLADYLIRISQGLTPYDRDALTKAFQDAGITDPTVLAPWYARFENMPTSTGGSVSNDGSRSSVSISGAFSVDAAPQVVDWGFLGKRLQVLGKNGEYIHLVIEKPADGWMAYDKDDAKKTPLWFGKADASDKDNINKAIWSASNEGAKLNNEGQKKAFDAQNKAVEDIFVKFGLKKFDASAAASGWSIFGQALSNGSDVRISPINPVSLDAHPNAVKEAEDFYNKLNK